ncbi:MAG TPA: MFS transporter [Gaiellales bacterium]|jgi:predicted MFS family arabinose efflux permease|nr:MFS transporter [Gaiellales bacterium]
MERVELPVRHGTRRIALLSAGAFVVGVDGTLLIGLLRPVGADLGVSVPVAGQAVSAFALSYALVAPLLIRAAGRLPMPIMVSGSLAVFAAANLGCAAATSFPFFTGLRVAAGAAAGVFMPTAALAASSALPAALRGRALALVIGGSSLAAALGVPAGVAVGTAFGWRAAFAALAIISLAVALLLAVVLRRPAVRPPPGQARPGESARRSAPVLLVTLLWSTGSFTFFTYLAPVLERSARAGGFGIALYLSLFGLAGVVGAWLSGRSTDRRGPLPTLIVALTATSAALAGMAAVTHAHLAGAAGGAATAGALIAYGLATWSVMPAQQHRLITVAAGRERLALSLNASALYAGVALGGGLGAVILHRAGVATVPAAAALIELAAAAVALAAASTGA